MILNLKILRITFTTGIEVEQYIKKYTAKKFNSNNWMNRIGLQNICIN